MASQTCSRASSRRQAARLLRIVKSFTNHTPNGNVSTFGPPERSPKLGKKRGSREGAAKGQPGCTRGQSLGKSGAAGKGVNPPNLRKNGAANPTKQTFIILKRNHATLKCRPRPPSPPRPPADRNVLEFYFGAPRKLWACNNEPSSSAATRWPFGAERAKLLSFAAQEKPTQENSTI